MSTLGCAIGLLVTVTTIGCAPPHAAVAPRPAKDVLRHEDPPAPADPPPPRDDTAHGICGVRWSSDGTTVARISDHSIEVRSPSSDAKPKVLRAAEGTRFLDYSIPTDLELYARGANEAFLKAASGDFTMRIDQRWAWPLVMTEDGRALFHAGREPFPGPIDDREFLDLASLTVLPIDVPSFSAGGSEQVAERVRRGAIQLSQSRYLAAMFSYRTPHAADGRSVGFVVPNCFALDSQGTAKLDAIDADESFSTAVVGLVDCTTPAPRKPMVEVYEHIGDATVHVARSFSVGGEPEAISLSADGRRAVITVNTGSSITRGLWDVAQAKRLGDVTIDADCFELSPDGSKLATVREGVLDVRAVP